MIDYEKLKEAHGLINGIDNAKLFNNGNIRFAGGRGRAD